MPMNWTPDANNKILLGLLDQLKAQSFKINYDQLAGYMGSECTKKSLMHQLAKLKNQAGGNGDWNGAADGGNGNGHGPATPKVTPKKRRSPTKGTPLKKGKGSNVNVKEKSGSDGEDVEVDDESDEEKELVKDVKAELRDLK